MRVALVDPSLFTLPYDVALARGLGQAGCDVTLHSRAPVAADGGTDGVRLAPDFYPLAESRLARALPKALRLAIKGVDHVASMRRLLARLRERKPDIIHFQWLPLPLIDSRLLSAFRRLAPVVLTVHDTDPFNGNPAAKLQRLGVDRALRGVDRLIVHTGQGRDRLLAQGLDGGRIDVLPHGSLSRAGASGPHGGPGDGMTGELTLLLFGKIKPYKGADVLIAAFAALPPALRAQARVRIVGKPYMDLSPLRAQAASLGVAERVSIEPDFIVDGDIDGLFGPRTIAVFPYREIEASGVLSFAIANGRPIIASRIGSFGEMLADGVHGRLVPPGDAGALTAAMAEMMGNRAVACGYGRAVRALSGEMPGWDVIGARTKFLYGSLKQKHPVGAG
jgi:glycosyltransferase involved in cell wall biosynthesis